MSANRYGKRYAPTGSDTAKARHWVCRTGVARQSPPAILVLAALESARLLRSRFKHKEAVDDGLSKLSDRNSALVSKQNNAHVCIQEACMMARAAGAASIMTHQFAAFVLFDLPAKIKLGKPSIGEFGRPPHLQKKAGHWGRKPLSTGIVRIPQYSLLQVVAGCAVGDQRSKITDPGRAHRERTEDARS